MPLTLNEEFYEDVIIERLCDEHGYTHLYGPDVERTSDRYNDVFLPGVLPAALRRINPTLPRQAIQEAMLKLGDVEGGSLAQRNEVFNDYLQSGVEVHFFDGKEERDYIDVYDMTQSVEDNAKQDYILTPGRYVGIKDEEDDGEPFEGKMERLTGELVKCFEESDRLQQ